MPQTVFFHRDEPLLVASDSEVERFNVAFVPPPMAVPPTFTT
jgi:hypothetical protein